jgi:uncharacterized membrane protein
VGVCESGRTSTGTPAGMRRPIRLPAIPLGAVAGVMAAGLLLGLDNWFGGPQIAGASARSLLGATFGALITAGAFAFWMLPIATQLATSSVPTSVASQHLRDRFQERVIAATVGALSYTGAVLLAVPSGTEGAPLLSTVAGGVIGVGSVSLLLVAIRHAEQSTRPTELLAEAAHDAIAQIGRASSRDRPGRIAEGRESTPATARVLAHRTGWVTSIDEGRLLDALDSGGRIRLYVAVGEFVVRDWTLLAEMSSSADETAGAASSPRALSRCVAIGSERSAREDVGGSLARFADVAVHAASDGNGSPSLAYEAIWYLGAILHELVWHDVSTTDRVVDGERVLERPREPSGAALAGSVTDRIRLATAGRMSLALELTQVLDDVKHAASLNGRHDLVDLLDRQRDLVYQQCERSEPLRHDLQRIADARADGDGRARAAPVDGS